MSNPVVVSRIQNRRGTQTQFLQLYPPGYLGIGGYGSGPYNPVSTTATSGTGTVATITLASGSFAVNDTITVANVTPITYNGTHTVISSTSDTVSFNSTATGAQTVSGTVFGTFTDTNYPNVLLPGELALCTDSRRIYMGNLNGEYVQLAELMMDGIFLGPIEVSLPPTGSFTVIPSLTYQATPFNTLIYSLTDSSSPNWNTVGNTFSKNGTLQITATTNFAPIPNPPFPDITPVTLTDNGTEINASLPSQISFKAQYDGTFTNIEILYMHDFSTNVNFNTSSVMWQPFV